MAPVDDVEPIADDELLYRRIPAQPDWCVLQDDPQLTPRAFRPTPRDTTGLSLTREKYKSVETAAAGREGKRYYVAVLRVGDVRTAGIAIQPDPLEGDPGHVILPALTYEHRHSDESLEMQLLLAKRLCLRVDGPFPR